MSTPIGLGPTCRIQPGKEPPAGNMPHMPKDPHHDPFFLSITCTWSRCHPCHSSHARRLAAPELEPTPYTCSNTLATSCQAPPPITTNQPRHKHTNTHRTSHAPPSRQTGPVVQTQIPKRDAVLEPRECSLWPPSPQDAPAEDKLRSVNGPCMSATLMARTCRHPF